MEAFFFGPSNKQVFATYHPASGGGGVVLTVICPPLFSDYILTHLVLRELAMALAERGQHVPDSTVAAPAIHAVISGRLRSPTGSMTSRSGCAKGARYPGAAWCVCWECGR